MSDFRDVDPELFFPIGHGPMAEAQTARARAVCRSCSVIGECLRWAIDTCQVEGVWGGTDPAERRVEIRRVQRQTRRALAR